MKSIFLRGVLFNYNNKPVTWPLAAILVIVFLAFSPALSQKFFGLDDNAHLLKNSATLRLDAEHLKQIFQSTVIKVYVPLTILSFAVEKKCFDYDPFFYHLNNLILHLGVTTLVWFIALRLGHSVLAAFLAALLFGLHPLRVEPVAWITGRKDLLYSFFYLLSTLCYFSWQQKESQDRKLFYYFAALACGFLSALAKPMAMSLPLTWLLWDWFRGRPASRSPTSPSAITKKGEMIVDKWPLVILLGPVIWVTYSLNARPLLSDFSHGLAVWLWSFSFYIQQFVFPEHLYPAYVLPQPITWSNPVYLTGAAIFLGAVLSLWFFRRQRWWILAWGYYFASIFFLLRFDDLAEGQITADRFMYLPSMGFCLWAGQFGAQAWWRGRRRGRAVTVAAALVGMILFMALGVKTFMQTRLWGQEEQLWNYALSHAPRSYLAHNARGNIFLAQGANQQAIADFSAAIKIFPRYAEAFGNRGIAQFRSGQISLALADYNHALILKPDSFPSVYANRGLAFFHIGEKEKARKDYERAISLDPRDATAYNNRGLLFFSTQEFEQAKKDFDRALELDENFVRAYSNRGNVFLMKQDYARAMADYNRALKLDPLYAAAYYNRSLAFERTGNLPAARADAKQAAALGFNPYLARPSR